MNSAHPPRDLLADYAAEILDPATSERVEAHVMACVECADLLAEAEGVRALLHLREEPGVMPQQVWDQVLAVIDAERSTGRTGEYPIAASPVVDRFPIVDQPVHAAPAGAAPTPTPLPHDQLPDDVTAQDPSSQKPDTTGLLPSWETSPIGTWDPVAAAVAAGATAEEAALDHPAALDGPSTPGDTSGPHDPSDPAKGAAASEPISLDAAKRRKASSRTRRDARDETSGGPWGRLTRPLGIAASVIAVVSLAGIGASKLFTGVGSYATSASGSAAAMATADERVGAYAAVVARSGTNYTKTTMDSQVQRLASPSQESTSLAGASPAASASARAQSTDLAAAPPTPAAGTNDITDPVRLQQCLSALGAGNDQPIAVDLARYEGKDAVIIVMPAKNGEYEVWVAAPSCSTAASGAIEVFQVPVG